MQIFCTSLRFFRNLLTKKWQKSAFLTTCFFRSFSEKLGFSAIRVLFFYYMKKILCFLMFLSVLLCGFGDGDSAFSLDGLKDYEKEYESEEISVCAYTSSKSYMDYRMITATDSRQYWYIRQYMTVDDTGLLLDEDGFIGVALGSYYGVIGDRYYFTLDTGIVLPLVKVEEKADEDTTGGCYHPDGSVLEFVVDGDRAGAFFGVYENGLILSGNFNNSPYFNGVIQSVEKVGTELNEHRVTYEEKEDVEFDNLDIFTYENTY